MKTTQSVLNVCGKSVQVENNTHSQAATEAPIQMHRSQLLAERYTLLHAQRRMNTIKLFQKMNQRVLFNACMF